MWTFSFIEDIKHTPFCLLIEEEGYNSGFLSYQMWTLTSALFLNQYFSFFFLLSCICEANFFLLWSCGLRANGNCNNGAGSRGVHDLVRFWECNSPKLLHNIEDLKSKALKLLQIFSSNQFGALQESADLATKFFVAKSISDGKISVGKTLLAKF